MTNKIEDRTTFPLPFSSIMWSKKTRLSTCTPVCCVPFRDTSALWERCKMWLVSDKWVFKIQNILRSTCLSSQFLFARVPYRQKTSSVSFKGKKSCWIVYVLGNVKWLWLQCGSCFGLLYFDLSQETIAMSFPKQYGPNPLVAGSLSSPWEIPPTTTICQGRLQMSKFCWISLKPASAFSSFQSAKGPQFTSIVIFSGR